MGVKSRKLLLGYSGKGTVIIISVIAPRLRISSDVKFVVLCLFVS